MISLYNMFKKAGHAALKVCKFIAKPFLAIKDACARVFNIIHAWWYSGKSSQTVTVATADVTTAGLSSNDLNTNAGTESAQAFTAPPAYNTALILANKNLGSKTGEELANIINLIPEHVTTLSLSNNELYKLRGAELAQALSAIKPTVTTLKLSWNNLGSKTTEELVQAFAAIKPSVTTLNLTGNGLDSKAGAELAEAFAAIKPSVTTLNLSWNNLGSKTTEELEQIFDAIRAISINFCAEEHDFVSLTNTLKSQGYYKFFSDNRFVKYQDKTYKDKQTEYASGLALTFNVKGLNEDLSSRILSFLTPSDWARLQQTCKKMAPYKHQAQSTETVETYYGCKPGFINARG